MSGIHHCLVVSPHLSLCIEMSPRSCACWWMDEDRNFILESGIVVVGFFCIKTILRLCLRSTPWTCFSARCGLMRGWNSRAPLKSCGWITSWWTKSGRQTLSSENPRSPFPITWPHPTSSSASCRTGLSFTPWGDFSQWTCSFVLCFFFCLLEQIIFAKHKTKSEHLSETDPSSCFQAHNQCRVSNEPDGFPYGRPLLSSAVWKLWVFQTNASIQEYPDW